MKSCWRRLRFHHWHGGEGKWIPVEPACRLDRQRFADGKRWECCRCAKVEYRYGDNRGGGRIHNVDTISLVEKTLAEQGGGT